MRYFVQAILISCILISMAVVNGYARKPEETPETLAKGKAIYEQVCIFCHGEQGKGDGPMAFTPAAYSAPRPNDFTKGEFKLRTTPTGELPTDEDLFRTVTNGIPGYMPPFAGLTEEQRWEVIAYVKTFKPAFKEQAPQPLSIGFPPIPSSPESIKKGREIFRRYECYTCHGADARGDGPVFMSGALKDNLGMEIQPTDLTNRASFKNGSTARDVFRSIMTGMNATPHPSYEGQFAGKEEDAWHLVNYILSLSPDPSP